jgi:hypothetical protein
MKNLTLALLVLCLAPLAGADTASTAAELRRLGERYEHGEGLAQDLERAYDLYCQAVRGGDRAAAFRLGWMRLHGRGIPRDDSLAAGWLHRAAEAGDSQAIALLARLRDPEPSRDTRCWERPGRASPQARAYADLVHRLAPSFGIDPDLALAIIRVESSFDPRAESAQQARGLMQLIPATAARFGVDDIWDPEQNIRGGLAYLHWLLRRFDGRVDLVTAAYNCGAAAVERYAGIPPYPETQRYVRRVANFYPETEHPIPGRRLGTDCLAPERSTGGRPRCTGGS